MIGIAGLAASVGWILDKGVANIHSTEQKLTEQFINSLQEIEGVRIVGPQTTENRCGVFSLVFDRSPHEISKQLEEEFGICSRSGLHCAPFAHETMGTTSLGGTVRVSLGPFHSTNDISHLTQAISNCTQKALV
jgi:selenocysteine lyase/cysteine desulfurase